MQKQQTVLQKEVRFMKAQQPGLSLYQVSHPMDMLFICPAQMNVFRGVVIDEERYCAKYLPSSPDSLIKVLTLAILEEAFGSLAQSRSLLRKIKQFAYNEQMSLAVKPLEDIPNEFQVSYNETGLRKMLVELFHLIESSQKQDKVLRFLTKHPFAVCILQTLFVNILKQDISNSQVTFDDVVASFSKSLGFSYEKIRGEVYRIGEQTYIGQDDRAIYKLCSSEDIELESDGDNDSSCSVTQGSARATFTEETNTTAEVRPSAFQPLSIFSMRQTPSRQEVSMPIENLRDTAATKDSLPTNDSQHSMHDLLKQINMTRADRKCFNDTAEVCLKETPCKVTSSDADLLSFSKVQRNTPVRPTKPQQQLYRPHPEIWSLPRGPKPPIDRSRQIVERLPHHFMLSSSKTENQKKLHKSFEPIPIQKRVVPFQVKQAQVTCLDSSRKQLNSQERSFKGTDSAARLQGLLTNSNNGPARPPAVSIRSSQWQLTPTHLPYPIKYQTVPSQVYTPPAQHFQIASVISPGTTKLVSNPARLPPAPRFVDHRIFCSRLVNSEPLAQESNNIQMPSQYPYPPNPYTLYQQPHWNH